MVRKRRPATPPLKLAVNASPEEVAAFLRDRIAEDIRSGALPMRRVRGGWSVPRLREEDRPDGGKSLAVVYEFVADDAPGA